MKAITLKQPWADAIFDLGKCVENRTWSTDYRGPLAIVAGKGWDEFGAEFVLARTARTRAESQFGRILGVVDLVDVHLQGSPGCDDLSMCMRPPLGWAEFRPEGHPKPVYHWVLADPQRVPEGRTFQYTGFLGIRDLGEPVANALLRALEGRAIEKEAGCERRSTNR